jgi:GDPmannose 4,6-dehydratase
LPKALVIGCNGQDGTLLSQLLSHKGYEVFGVDRVAGRRAQNSINFSALDVCDARVKDLIRQVSPDEVYYLAAYHHSAEQEKPAPEVVTLSLQVNTLGLSNVLGAIAESAKRTRLFYAASSRVFGDPPEDLQDENTSLSPLCAYGISKAAGIHLCRYFRREQNVYASVGILYNHESPLRSEHFVTKKIVRAAVRIRADLERELVLGNLDARVDWGWAPDYVEAMHAVLGLDGPNDFVIATGALHSVREFVDLAFGAVGLDWRRYVVERKSVLEGQRTSKPLCGNAERLRNATDWRPHLSFKEIVETMISAEEGQPWTAFDV